MTKYSKLLGNVILPIGDSLRGIPIQEKYALLRESQFYSSETIKENQITLFRKLVENLEFVPYYRNLMKNLNIIPDDIDSLEKIELFPKLTKGLALQENHALQKDGLNFRKVQKAKTGGSTGEPLPYIHDRITQAFNRACHYRGLSWADFEWGEPMVCLFGGTLGFNRTSITEVMRSKLTKQFFYPAFEVKQENLPEIIGLFKKVKPKALIGYTSSIYQLCSLFSENHVDLHVPIVFTTGEILPQVFREFINEVLNCRVHDYYGFGEIQGLAYQCPVSENYHISDEKVILEIESIPEFPNPLIGRALFTDLTNYSFPFIRYEPGDIVELSAEKCVCGRNLTSIKRIIGRKNDFVRTSDGKVLAGIFFPHLFSKISSIRYYQIVQDEIDHITIKYIPLNDIQDLQHQKSVLVEKIREYTSQKMIVSFEEVQDLPKTPSGKLQVVISNIIDRK